MTAAVKVDLKPLDAVTDHKEFKKLLKSKTNILVLYHKISAGEWIKICKTVASVIRGEGTIVEVDCAKYVTYLG